MNNTFNNGVKTPWWITHRQQRYKKRNFLSMSMIIRKSIKETFIEYWNATSIGGVNQIRNAENSTFERVCYAIIFCMTFLSVCQFLHTTWVDTFARPPVVTAESSTHPINNIDFPAIALCNFNKISKKALSQLSIDYIKSLKLQQNNVTFDILKKYFQHFGRLVGHLHDHNMHEKLTKSPMYEAKIDVMRVMEKLMPRCEEMLIKCRWAGQDVNCSEIFQRRRTGLGYCCAFNYVLAMNSADRPERTIATVKRQQVPGPYNGLLVIADPLAHDNAYQITERNGFQVLIHDPRLFPEISGGRALYRIASPNQIDVLQIESVKQYSSPEVRKYPIKTRNCLFPYELEYNNMYSYGACLVKCRIETIQTLCKCIPFFYPTELVNRTKTCTLADLSCLDKYNGKLLYLYPMDTINEEGLESELAESLFCPDCLPDCELTQHSTRNFQIPFPKQSYVGFGGDFLDDVNITDKCVVTVYHATATGVLHRLDVVSCWYEILSNIGGFTGMLMGIGCYTLVECFYYIIIRLPRNVYIKYKNNK